MEARSLLEIERKRATVRKYLFEDPNSARLWAIVNDLLAPDHVRLAASHGIVIVCRASVEPQARKLAQHLQSRGFEAVVRVTGQHAALGTTIVTAGVVILILGARRDFDPEMQHSYKTAMLMGKVLLAVVHSLDDLPNLLFDLPPLFWSRDLEHVQHTLDTLLISA